MMRYELHSMLNKHHYLTEKKNDLFLLGNHPLSKVDGMLVKDVVKNLNQKDKIGNNNLKSND